MIASIWAKKNKTVKLKTLLSYFNLKRPTYYDELHRLHKPDKYAHVENKMKELARESKITYGYRRMWRRLQDFGYYYCPETIRRLMHKLGLIVKVFSHHTTKYSSYRGTVGKIAPNRLHQIFHQYWPYRTLHTDITQINMMNRRRGYISAIVDEATKEVLSVSISLSPNMNLVFDTLKRLKHAIPNGIKAILHSDQGWQYQMPEYRHTLKKMNLIQSMSRKGNCHDNAPIESFFHLLKVECLNRCKIHNVHELKEITYKYIHYFNNLRISMKTKGMTPIDYRNHVLA